MASDINLHVEIVNTYYKLVDDKELDNLLSLFSQNIYYKRCGLEIRGMDELEKFYKQGRSIAGKHTITKIYQSNDDSVVAEGRFDGQWNDGRPLSIHFADFFFFDGDAKIFERHTYTDQGVV